MRWARSVAAAVGLGAFTVGVAAVVAPGVVDAVPVTAALAVVGHDYLLVVPFAVAGVVACVSAVALVAARGVTEATPPAPEGVPVGDPPGADLDRLLVGRRGVTTRLDPDVRRQVHRRLRDAVVATVARTGGYSREVARERVEDGSWTDDAVAAGFVRSPPARWTELPGLVRGESRFQRGTHRTVAALQALAEGSA